MTINVKEVLEEIIQYLDGMKFPVGASKVVQTQIAHKSRNYTILGNQLYFQGWCFMINHWKRV
jgi:phosphosulfolactate synthase (CoM biosynthesis protein A)